MKQKNNKTIFPNFAILPPHLSPLSNFFVNLFIYYKKIGIFFLIFSLCASPALALIPNDAGYSFQWHLEKINAPEAWDITIGSKDVIIAFIDSGIDISHPDLKQNIWINMDEINGDNIDNDRNGYSDDAHGWNFVENNNDVRPQFEKKCLNNDGTVKENCKLGINHGTIIAGIAAAEGNNKRGIAGITWNSKIMPLRALDGAGNGENDSVVNAVNYAVENGADIINLSLVGEGYYKGLEEALRNAYQKGILIIAAAGNNEKGGIDMDKNPRYPVCYKGKNGENIAIGVAGTDKNDIRSVFSNYGKNCIDIAAPAEDFYSASVYNAKYDSFEGYYSGLWSGTSLAAPIISGLAALIKSARPALSNSKIYELIINNADQTGDDRIGAGRVNILESLKFNFNGKRHESYIIVSPQNGKEAEIREFRNDGIYAASFLAYEENYLNGLSLASGDVDGDHQSEIIAAKYYGSSPVVRVYDYNGNLKSEFNAYNENFRGGVNIASGDVNGDGINEIIAGAGTGGGPHIKIFDFQGNLKAQFFAYAQSFKGGVKTASGDIDGDGENEIIAGAGKGGRAHIRIFDIYGNVKAQFFAYEKNFFGGVNVAAGDINGDGLTEIITSPISGGGPHIRIFSPKGDIIGQFFAFEKEFHGGVNIASDDMDNNGKAEIIASKGYGGNSEIKVFDAFGNEKLGFSPFAGYNGGVNVGTVDI